MNDDSNLKHKFGTVVLLGPPNAGKSTLLNKYLGQKVAIVSPKPQTTRNQITGILTDDNSQIMFLDTPGVHRLRGKMNKFLLQAAWASAESADVMVVLADADLYTQKPHLLEKEMTPLIQRVKHASQPVFVAVNKTDCLKTKSDLLPLLAKFGEMWPEAQIFPISAVNGDGLDVLLERMKAELPECPPMFPEDQLSTIPMRFMAAEIVREKLFLNLRQELPYSTAVEIESWTEEDNLTHIDVLIWVGQKSHKSMVIGKGGANLKTIGTAARKEIKQMIGSKIHMQMWVKVRRDWTEDVGFLRTIGLSMD